jgi:uncharacterized protein (DUF305 family)
MSVTARLVNRSIRLFAASNMASRETSMETPMKHRLAVFTGIAALAFATAGLAEDQSKPANPAHEHSAMAGQTSAQSKGSQDLHKAMMDGMQEMHSMKMTGNTDVDFAAMMIEHHEQAIAMSKAQLENGKDPEVKRKANEIIAASEKDIADLKKWKSQHGSASR